MSHHEIQLTWTRQTPDFQYDTYDRTHSLVFAGGQKIAASSAPEYLGRAENANPEEMLAASLASCHMLTFLAVAAKSRFVVDSYLDRAVAVLEKNEDGRLAVTEIILNPKIQFSGEKVPDAEQLKALHDKAHRNCFIGNSIKARVTVKE